MSWVVFAALAAIFISLMDFFIKLSGAKIESGLGSLIINAVSVVPPLIWVVWLMYTGEKIHFTKEGGIYSILAGIAIGVGTIFFLKMFATGTNLSIGVPLVKVGAVVIAVFLGTLLLREGMNTKLLIGFLLSIIGLYLLVGGAK